MEDLTGKQFGPYQIVAPLGEGGMAAVYKAYQPGMDRYVALKVLPQHLANNPEFASRFEQEAKMLAKLQHPHILPVFDFGQSDNYTYIVMPFIQSGDLTDLLQDQPLPLPQIRRIISQIGDALDYAHQRGLIHRDVKPSNVLLDERGNCLLTDFGIAKMVESSRHLTVTGGIIGTPAYMSPEQGAGEKLDNRSDIYALGIMLYEMATGRVPYRAETPMAIIIKHMLDPLPMPRQTNPTLPEAVERVILKSLAKQPADRYPTAGEMVQALQTAIPETLTGQSVPSVTTVTLPDGPADSTLAGGTVKLPAPAPPSGARRWWIGGAALVLVLLAAFFGLTFFTPGSSTPSATLIPPKPTPGPTESPLRGESPEPPKATPTPTTLSPTQPPPTETPVEPSSTPAQVNLTRQIYDDFNDAHFDGGFNTALWWPQSDESCQVKQQEGTLSFTAPVQTTDVSCEVVVAKPKTVSFDALETLEVRLKVNSDHTGSPINLGLALSRPDLPDGQWYTFCGLSSAQAGQIEASFEVANYAPSQKQDFWQSLPAAYDQWYTFKLQADPATMALTCSVDGVAIGTTIPNNATELRQAKISRSLGSYRQAGAAATTLADEVVFESGPSANLPPETESDPALYDNFDDPAFDGSFNPTQWAFFSDTENGGQAVQSEGAIELERYDQSDGAIGLEAIAYNQPLSTPTTFAADLMLTGPQNGHVYLTVGPEWMSKEYADCIFGHSNETGAIDCNYYYVNEDKLAYESPDFSVEYNTWHTVKIEVDPATMTFTFYMDDELLGDFTPANAKAIKNNDFTFNIGLWGESNEALTGYVDKVRVGQP